MKHVFDNGWEIYPAGGLTGEAFYARLNDEKLFIKRNSSPFLAVLSAEGIVPKLVWTKRLESGDVITAQHFLSGRILNPQDMNDERVAKLLKKIHHSKPLLSMLRRLGKTPVYPNNLLIELDKKLNDEIKKTEIIKQSLQYLGNQLPESKIEQFTVCHGDVNHNNWMLSEDNQLYLIDWEAAIIGDPAIDIGPLLYWYIPREDWNKWLAAYGVQLTPALEQRLKWYTLFQSVYMVSLFKDKGKEKDCDSWLQKINEFF